MKKIFSIFFLGLLFAGCTGEEAEVYKVSDGTIAYFTAGTTDTYFVQDTPNSSTLIEVGVTVASPEERTFTVSVDPSSTATPDQYTIDQSSLVIPANSYVGYLKVAGNYAAASITGSTLVLKLDSVEGAEVLSTDAVFSLEIFQFCPLVRDEFLGTYAVTEYDAAGAVIDTYTSDVTAGEGPNDILMSNIYNFSPDSQTKLTLNDADPSNFVIEFPPFLQNFLLDGGAANGFIYVEGFSGTFSACQKELEFTYRLRFGAGNGGTSATATYRVVAVLQ
ncbi:hypothetical protein [Flavobacterium aurantiibacter]|uniref:DUF1735 domain-containing protein n=1 Tax=Flavobacterium aurantiibacter TaxID=2023067 RepID=A0A255ZQN3_9FLAO|nr:hypothetical protein [Flavobacterium aurantiibacter]OYQ43185.1 hypothetical protein CHX27_10645 [Flavobacterium aurantiibacter]